MKKKKKVVTYSKPPPKTVVRTVFGKGAAIPHVRGKSCYEQMSDVYGAGIPARIEWHPYGGFEATVGDDSTGIIGEAIFDGFQQACAFIYLTAQAYQRERATRDQHDRHP